MSKFTKGLPNSPGYYFCCKNEKEKDILSIITIVKREYADDSIEYHYRSYNKELYPFLLYKTHGTYNEFSIVYRKGLTPMFKIVNSINKEIIEIKDVTAVNDIFAALSNMLFSKIEIPRE